MPNSAIAIQSNEIAWFFVLNVGRKPGSPYFRKSRWKAFNTAGYPACLIAGMQESRNVRKRERLQSKYQACLTERMTDGMR
ncbi:hypothetical protein [Arcicella sp. BE51]|uniref:hypothetical protein n=1 Tax=Arcicella sp. BE51 TaxID=2817774 RepID=UPI00285831E0|nr:hypothetical protein [Arcicella sp. BE51]MCA6441066.1 hypothetical protein [Chitinophagaceae bacterium]MDR6561474.1 hypothetical protein [Arcicella sp. BE51]MDR6822708.1 hypothetical protein [Arcicella sp. BE139]